ncbi:hypothetical protein niasHT_038411 [Heterodera trifolii]|uniref:Uncharacterized protein n=1 Tax=Heterodera trifolii TaxID=157864 RepID=A0ABD2IID1_9BILA
MLTRDERRKIRRERKAMSDKADDGTRIPEGLVELKFEAPASSDGRTIDRRRDDDKVGFRFQIFHASAGPMGSGQKGGEKARSSIRPTLSFNLMEKKRAKHYDDLPEQSYGPGSADYSQ